MPSAVAIAEAVRTGQSSAEEAVRASLTAIDALNGELGAVLDTWHDAALAQARRVDARVAQGDRDLPLAGVPIAVKDNICTRDAATTCASRILANYRPPYDSTVIERLNQAGAVVVGKTNLDEFAMGTSSEHSSVRPVANPWDLTRVPGGSSGGSAAAVAAGMVPVALGSDTGGSIRQPAGFCGVVGLKPTYGRVSRYGLIAYGSSLDQIGPLARTAEDAALVLSVIAGHDPRDSTSIPEPVPNYAALLDELPTPLRIGVPRKLIDEGADPQTRQAVAEALSVLADHGATLVDIDLPHLKYGIAAYYIIATAEASSNLARYDGVHYGHRASEHTDVIDMYAASREEGFGEEVKRRIMLGTYVLSSGYYDAYYLRAMKVRTLLRRDFETAFEQVDVVAMPVSPTTAFRLGEKLDDPLAMYLADVYTITANLAGIPALSVPCGFDDAGLPIGLQLHGPALAEQRLLALAHRYQQLTEHHRRQPTHAG